MKVNRKKMIEKITEYAIFFKLLTEKMNLDSST